MGRRNSTRGIFLVAAAAAVLVLAGLGVQAEVHLVGDSAGWTIIGNVNYGAWASAKAPFRKGDTLVFVYNNQFHNVLEVTKAAYRACDATSPIAAYSSGNDTVTVKRMGHTFFICGFPGHCQLGQKLDVRVPKTSNALATAPSGAPAAGAPAVVGGGPASVGGGISLAPESPAAAAANANNKDALAPSALTMAWAIICGLLVALTY